MVDMETTDRLFEVIGDETPTAIYQRIDEISHEVGAEIFRAIGKHGSESMASTTLDVGKRLGILGEEFGEVCRATTYDNADRVNLREELIQTAAMAAAWVLALDAGA